jgi:hypothetical protein
LQVIENAKKSLQSNYSRSANQAPQGVKPPGVKRGVRGAFVPPIKAAGGTAVRKSDKGAENGGDEENETIRKL